MEATIKESQCYASHTVCMLLFFGSARWKMKEKNVRHIGQYAFIPHTEYYLRNKSAMLFIKSSTMLTTIRQERERYVRERCMTATGSCCAETSENTITQRGRLITRAVSPM